MKFCFQSAGCLPSLEDLRCLVVVKFELHAYWASNCRTPYSSPSSGSYLPGRPRSLADGGPGEPPIPARLSRTGSVFHSQSPVAWSPWHVVQFNSRPAPKPLYRCPCTSLVRNIAALAYADSMARAIEKRLIDRKRKVETLRMATTIVETQWGRLPRSDFLVPTFVPTLSYRLSRTDSLVPTFVPTFSYRLSRTDFHTDFLVLTFFNRLSRTDLLVPTSYRLSRTDLLVQTFSYQFSYRLSHADFLVPIFSY